MFHAFLAKNDQFLHVQSDFSRDHLTCYILLKSLFCVDYGKQDLKSDNHTPKIWYAFEKFLVLLCRTFCYKLIVVLSFHFISNSSNQNANSAFQPWYIWHPLFIPYRPNPHFSSYHHKSETQKNNLLLKI